MLQFDQFVARHGEIAAQALLENLERFEGIRPNTVLPLDQRWERLMTHGTTRTTPQLLAA